MEDHNFGITKQDIISLCNSIDINKHQGELERVASEVKSTKELAKRLKTDLDKGIPGDETDKARRIKAFDSNYKERVEPLGFCYFVTQTLEDTFLRILIFSAFLQIAIGASPFSENPKKDWIDGLAILFAVIVIVFTASITNYSKEKKFRKMVEEERSMRHVLVKRNGVLLPINEEDILVGDVLKIEVGMILPADAIIISGDEVKVDESSITGESALVKKETLENSLKFLSNINNKKKECGPFLFAGTVIKSGSGWTLILAVGDNSNAGRIRQTVLQNSKEDENTKSPLEIKLEEIAEDIGKFGLVAAVLTLTVLLTKLLYMKWNEYEFHKGEMEKYQQFLINNGTFANTTLDAYGNNSTDYQNLVDPSLIFSGIYKEIFTIIILCIAIIVVAIPEGLPLAVTLALSFSVHKMMNDNNMVKTMQACETMGGANYICTDKTGTLTRNQMQVVSIFNSYSEVDLRDVDRNSTVSYQEKFRQSYYNIFKECLINNLQIELDENNELIQHSSNRTDTAFYEMFKGFGEIVPNKGNNPKIHSVIGFTSERKKMSTIVRLGNNQYRILIKGAPNIIYNSCNTFFNQTSGENSPMSNTHLNKIKEVNVAYEHQLLRCIAFAYKDVSHSDIENFKDFENADGSYSIEEDGFTFIGLAAISDTLRPGVEQSLNLCYNAGINVIMITGDMIDIGVAIAKNANIIRANEDFLALIGADFYNKIGGIVCGNCSSITESCICPKTIQQAIQVYGDNKDDDFYESKVCKQKIGDMREFKKIIKNLKVIARARPMDKFALVLGLKDLDNVVAVTGDGTNDSPALSKADVGFAMGISGTDIAKDAADIIILDDNFTSIIHAIKWGRNIFDNIRKFIQFQLSVNISAVLLVFCSSCIGSESPISAIQMLWINMIMDSLGSLSLATESPTPELLNRKPHSKREYIITHRMWKHILFQSLFQFTLVFLLYLYAPSYIIENDPTRIEITRHIENCFGKFPGEVIKYEHHGARYFILDGKKSSWDPLKLIKPNLDPSICFFYDTDRFEPKQISNLYQAYKWYNSEYGNTVHMTIIFNSFVFFALFNQINSRILDDGFNIFKNIFKNYFFLVIFIIEIVCQVCIIQYGGLLFKVAVGGLSRSQWLICVGLGSVTFFISVFLKCFKLEGLFSYNYSGKLKKIFKCSNKKKDDAEMNQQLVDDSVNNSVDAIELAIQKSEKQ